MSDKEKNGGATESDQEQAKKAQQEFEKGNLDGTLAIIGKLASAGRAQDPKLIHNKAIVEFYKSKFTKTDEFQRSLLDAIAKSHVNPDTMSGLEDLDQSAMCYNLAVLCYYTRQYQRGLHIADKLLQFIEPMDEAMSRKIIFLTAELYLATQQPERALSILAYAEKNPLGTKGGQGPEKEGREGEVGEAWRPRAGVYKAACYLMLHSLKMCKRELKALVNVTSMTVPVVYLKAHFEYLRGNYRKAIKVLSGAAWSPHPSSGPHTTGECLPVLYYNNMAVVHFHINKPHLAAFYLRKALQENQQVMTSYGQHEPGKTQLSGCPLPTVGLSRHYELLYNLGVTLLHCGKPAAAFEALVETVQVYHLNHRLWLRLAECCIMAHRTNNNEDRKLSNRLEVIQGSVGSGVHRKLILGSGLQKHKSGQSSTAAIPISSLEFASLCLRNALHRLPEEGYTGESVPKPDSDMPESPEHRTGVDTNLFPASPSSPLRRGEVANLRCSILASSSYVSLCLSDHLLALNYAVQLLQQPRLSGAHRYLGHMYQAEALIALDKIADAISHLNPELLTDVSTAYPEQRPDVGLDKNGDRDQQDAQEPKVSGVQYAWSPADVPQARALMLHNLATAHAVRGEYDKALTHLSKSIVTVGTPLPAQMYFLKLYLELMEGRKKTVHNIIKEHFGHVTPNRM